LIIKWQQCKPRKISENEWGKGHNGEIREAVRNPRKQISKLGRRRKINEKQKRKTSSR